MVSSASSETYPQIFLSAFTKFLPKQRNLELDWEVVLLKISLPPLINNVTSGKFIKLEIALYRGLEEPLANHFGEI